VPSPVDPPDFRPRPRPVARHGQFLDRLEQIGTKRDPAWAATAGGLRLLRFLDTWVEIGPSIMRGNAPRMQLREGIDIISEEWADLRASLLVAYDALSFLETAPDAKLSATAIRAAWLNAVTALTDAAECYERRNYCDLATGMYAGVLDRLPPADERRATKRSEAIERLAARARDGLARLDGYAAA
jgi:hypothetical protein